MLEGRSYTLSELTQILKESASESKPKIDPKVIKDDAQNNVKAVKDIMKQTSDYNNVKSPKRNTNPEQMQDFNKTTLDVDFAYEPSKDYKDRIKAQAHGFPSVENEKNSKIKDENESLDFQGNEDFYDANKEKNKKLSDIKTDSKHAGLKSHNLPKDTFKNNTPFTESKKMKRLHFSNTEFLTEEQMLKKIPDAYKKDGNKFYMKDKKGREYMIECQKDPVVDYVYTKIVGYSYPQGIVEERAKMDRLAEYDSSAYQNSSKKQLNENAELVDMMAKCKELSQKKKK